MINYSGAREVARTPANIYDEELCNHSYRLLIIFDKLFMFAGSLRSNHRRCCVRKGVLRNFAKFIWKNLCQSLFFNKVEAFNFIKKDTLAQVFSCEFWEISKNTFITEHLRTTASLKWNEGKLKNQWNVFLTSKFKWQVEALRDREISGVKGKDI